MLIVNQTVKPMVKPHSAVLTKWLGKTAGPCQFLFLWLTYPSEKSWTTCQVGWWNSQYDGKVIIQPCSSHHQPDFLWQPAFFGGKIIEGFWWIPPANDVWLPDNGEYHGGYSDIMGTPSTQSFWMILLLPAMSGTQSILPWNKRARKTAFCISLSISPNFKVIVAWINIKQHSRHPLDPIKETLGERLTLSDPGLSVRHQRHAGGDTAK
jgi:hypothetical protein